MQLYVPLYCFTHNSSLRCASHFLQPPTLSDPLTLLANGDRHTDARDVGHGHLERLVQQAKRLEVPGCIRDRIVTASVAGVGKHTGRRLSGDLDPESPARIGAAIPGSRVFGHVILAAASGVSSHKGQDPVEATQLESAE